MHDVPKAVQPEAATSDKVVDRYGFPCVTFANDPNDVSDGQRANPEEITIPLDPGEFWLQLFDVSPRVARRFASARNDTRCCRGGATRRRTARPGSRTR